MSNSFTLPGNPPVCLDTLATQLSETISHLPPAAPKMARSILATQTGAEVMLVVVRDHEPDHSYEECDLILQVLHGGGFVQFPNGPVDAPVGATVFLPRGLGHAYYNTAKSDSVLLGTFCPKFLPSIPCYLPPVAAK
jgi:mannose-6-phosphate isomerase-like protein (cupin superfamily)